MTPHAPGRFARLAAFADRHRAGALVLWVAVLAAVTVLASVIGSDYRNDYALPGTDSERAVAALERADPAAAGDTVEVVLQAPGGLETVRDRVDALAGELDGMAGVASVTPPFDDPTAMVSDDGTIAYASVALDGRATDAPAADVLALIDTAQAAAGDGLRVELTGEAVRTAQESGGGAAEGAGMLAALVILVLLFGSLLAASLPLITAVFAVGSSVGLIVLASHVSELADFTPPLMLLVGLGVGIDYALLIFSRFRSELLAGAPRDEAVRTALDTAGRAVFFAAGTVIVALAGLYVLGISSLQGVALGVALTVAMTMLSSLTLLPALLGVFGARIERSVRRRAAKGHGGDGARWARLAGAVGRRPWTALLATTALLVALAVGAADMRLGFADAGSDAATTTSRAAYDLLSEGFGPGFNGPLVVVGERLGEGGAGALRDAVAATPGVAFATPPQTAGDVATTIAFPDSSPQDAATDDLVATLRADVAGDVERAHGGVVSVGGATAAAIDFTDTVTGRLPLFLLVVVGLSTLLLMAVFRSVLIPLKAAVLNVLTIGAALGVMTAVFSGSGPIEAFVPVVVFAVVFGLSMDYEVFLVSRMREAWERTGDPGAAIRDGLAGTGRVITAAALIMMVVFGAFILSPERFLQQMGLGMAVAIALDAFVVRCLLVPAVMHLFGDRAWWVPGWLGRRLPTVPVERPQRVPS